MCYGYKQRIPSLNNNACLTKHVRRRHWDRVREDTAVRVSGGNENVRRLVSFCDERRLYVGNTYFKHKNIRKHTRAARGSDRMEAMSVVDSVLVKKYMRVVKRKS